LRAELLRCQHLGQAALNDTACAAVWAENRRRFFGAQPEAKVRAGELSKFGARAP
jgi:hypothetical protein